MIYFTSRDAARSFKSKSINAKKLIDLGAGAPKRWAVQIM